MRTTPACCSCAHDVRRLAHDEGGWFCGTCGLPSPADPEVLAARLRFRKRHGLRVVRARADESGAS